MPPPRGKAWNGACWAAGTTPTHQGRGPGCTDLGIQECSGGGGNSQPQLLPPAASRGLFHRPELSISGLGEDCGLQLEGEEGLWAMPTHVVGPFRPHHIL